MSARCPDDCLDPTECAMFGVHRPWNTPTQKLIPILHIISIVGIFTSTTLATLALALGEPFWWKPALAYALATVALAALIDAVRNTPR